MQVITFSQFAFFRGFCFGGFFFGLVCGVFLFNLRDSCTVMTKECIDTIAKHDSAAYGNGF